MSHDRSKMTLDQPRDSLESAIEISKANDDVQSLRASSIKEL